MMAELRDLKVEILICDSPDRFTRNVLDGGRWVSEMTDIGVRLAIIEKDDGRLLDMRQHSDRKFIADSFMVADSERDRLSKRQQKRYTQQRSRGATVTNRPAFGLRLSGDVRGNRSLVPDPDSASIVAEMDRRCIEGASMRTILAWLADFPGAWRSRRGLSIALHNENDRCGFVKAGVRTPETQALIRSRVRSRYGSDRKLSAHEHHLIGLLACGECVDAGLEPKNALLHGRYYAGNLNPHLLVCTGVRGSMRLHREALHTASLLMPALIEYVETASDEEVAAEIIDRYEAQPFADEHSALRAKLMAQWASVESEIAEVDRRIAAVLELVETAVAGAVKIAMDRFVTLNAERLKLKAKLGRIQSRIAELPATPQQGTRAEVLRALSASAADAFWKAFDGDEVVGKIERRAPDVLTTAYDATSGYAVRELAFAGLAPTAELRTFLKPWIAALGHPIVVRRDRSLKRWRRRQMTKVKWPGFDRLAP